MLWLVQWVIACVEAMDIHYICGQLLLCTVIVQNVPNFPEPGDGF